jgi:hypothetical protein
MWAVAKKKCIKKIIQPAELYINKFKHPYTKKFCFLAEKEPGGYYWATLLYQPHKRWVGLLKNFISLSPREAILLRDWLNEFIKWHDNDKKNSNNQESLRNR